MTSRHCPQGQHSVERLFSSIFRRIRKSSRKGDKMHVTTDAAGAATDAESESAATTSSGAGAGMGMGVGADGGGGGGPGAAEAEAASSSSVLGGDDDSLPSGEDSGDSPLPDFLTLDELHQHRVKPGNLQLFSERLSDFVRFVQRVHDLARATYDHPATLQRRLERDLGELRALLAAVRDAVATVQRLRAQRAAVRKEKGQVRKHLRKLREEEVREMESIVAVYDKAMYARWENVRHTHKADALNALLNDVKGKQQAMENLCVLIQRKQAQLQGQSPCGGGAHGGDRERPPAASPTAGGGGGGPTLSDALAAASAEGTEGGGGAAASTGPGGAGGNKRHVTPGSARTVALRRRRHHERQQDAQSAAAAAASAGVSGARWEVDISMPLRLPAPPPPSPPSPAVARPAPAATPPPQPALALAPPPSAEASGPAPQADSGSSDAQTPAADTHASEEDRGSAGGSERAGESEVTGGGGGGGGGPIPSLAASSPSLSPNSDELNATPLGHTELHEMRGVLQALFSDLHIGSAANVEDIDLFAVQPSQASNPQ